jgi:hypothetical protein
MLSSTLPMRLPLLRDYCRFLPLPLPKLTLTKELAIHLQRLLERYQIRELLHRRRRKHPHLVHSLCLVIKILLRIMIRRPTKTLHPHLQVRILQQTTIPHPIPTTLHHNQLPALQITTLLQTMALPRIMATLHPHHLPALQQATIPKQIPVLKH